MNRRSHNFGRVRSATLVGADPKPCDINRRSAECGKQKKDIVVFLRGLFLTSLKPKDDAS